MLRLKIDRFLDIRDGTVGKFYLFNKDSILFSGYTLEPSGPDTITPNQDKRIPQGIYNATFYRSPRFNRRLPLLFNENVSKSRYILIHNGNFPKDTEGCILVGNKYNERGVFNSNDTLQRLLKLLHYQDFEAEINNA